ncbi:MAG: flagellar hook-basal body protein [Oscillospiraceae bacterium]|nr:flagellar hook-basal body protein [Oscillospiraceae bacterium]
MSSIGFYSSASGVFTAKDAMDITANNVANVNTNGYKHLRPSFGDLIYTERKLRNEEVQTGHGSRVLKTDLMYGVDSFAQTEKPLDFAIAAEGLFAVREGDSITYTRDGSFYMSQNAEGVWELVNNRGAYVLDNEGNNIPIPFIDGTTEIDRNTLTETIGVYNFNNPYGLDPVGDNYFVQTRSSGEPQADPEARKLNGYLEMSSVNLGTEMVKVIEFQRGFQANVRMVQTHDELQNIINHLRQ